MIDRASVEEWLAEFDREPMGYVSPGNYAELARELQRLWRVEEAARRVSESEGIEENTSEAVEAMSLLDAALANPADRFHAGHGPNPHPNCPVCASPAAEAGE